VNALLSPTLWATLHGKNVIACPEGTLEYKKIETGSARASYLMMSKRRRQETRISAFVATACYFIKLKARNRSLSDPAGLNRCPLSVVRCGCANDRNVSACRHK
jgi:hypothetical protein